MTAARARRQFPAMVLRAIDETQRIGIRAGRAHRCIAVWAVVVEAAIDRAYVAKCTSPGSVRYTRGFRSQRRRATTMELVPR